MIDHPTPEQKGKEKKRRYTPPPLSQPLRLLHTAPSSGWELPDFSSRQEVHHRLVALFHGKQLRDLHVSASARFPARRFSHRLP